jgi:hypothetical protein
MAEFDATFFENFILAHSADIHQSEDTLCNSEPLTNAFHLKISKFQRTLSVLKTLELSSLITFLLPL